MAKLLKTAFVILLVISFIEVFYYLFYLNSFKLLFSKPDTADISGKQAVNETEPPGTPAISVTPAVHPDVLERLRNYKYDPKSKMSIKTELQTEIKDIDYDGRQSGGDFYPFALKIVTTSGRDFWMYFPNFLYQKVKVYSKTDGVDQPLKPGDLKIGDTVLLVETYNPRFAPDNPEQVISYEIFRIQ
ncbi:MAG: hypothetical protein UV73_C0002G0121 [Candidatus Gottesmanbacteria bacterium GW2011_GWA2_43_14]|uniref:Uncharacterized protein n=1 Tax=Candidatus Gottesmanbacteria bacterium GW2011_GWA2_43_14 TaxID=1618443 RepID=A0A0G1DLD8_9BACT|nr:MAG: hypothetical protein UV73_C0002G0121 [Candidatus Gottesmanbacteria bacterium GW2011_GWA2_43_14]